MAEVRGRADVEALAAISAIEQRLRALIERDLPVGVSAAAFQVMERLSRHDAPAGPADLADALSLTRPALSHTLGRLQAQGLIRMAPDPEDGRRKRLSLTRRGEGLHRDCVRALRPRLGALRRAMDAAGIERALPALMALRAFLDGEATGTRS